MANPPLAAGLALRWSEEVLAVSSLRSPGRLRLAELWSGLRDHPCGHVAFRLGDEGAIVEVPSGRVGSFVSGLHLSPGSERTFDLGNGLSVEAWVTPREVPVFRSPWSGLIGGEALVLGLLFVLLSALLTFAPDEPPDRDEQLVERHHYLMRAAQNEDAVESTADLGAILSDRPVPSTPVRGPFRLLFVVVDIDDKPVAGCPISFSASSVMRATSAVTDAQGRAIVTFYVDPDRWTYLLDLNCPGHKAFGVGGWLSEEPVHRITLRD